MKITRISVWAMQLPLTKPYWLSGGRLKFETLDSTFVRLDTDAGISGWGEGCPWGHTYLPAHAAGIRAGMETLADAVIGCNPLALDAVNQRMDDALPAHPYVKSAIDIACWDILGKFCNLPLWQLLGGESAESVPVNSSIATGTAAAMVQDMEDARAAGYRTHSAKIGGLDIAADIARIEAMEAALRPDEAITYDINRAWTPALAVQILNSVAVRGWIEQPCETLSQCAQVARRIPQPLMLDECLHDMEDHLQAWRLSAGEGIKLKPNRVGGLTKARRIRDLGVAVGWRMHVEDVGGSVFADTVAVHLAAATPPANRLPSWLCHAHLAHDPFIGQGARNDKGFTKPPSIAGVGITPNPENWDAPVGVYDGN